MLLGLACYQHRGNIESLPNNPKYAETYLKALERLKKSLGSRVGIGLYLWNLNRDLCLLWLPSVEGFSIKEGSKFGIFHVPILALECGHASARWHLVDKVFLCIDNTFNNFE
jgi:hypothetical protein